MLPGSKGRKLPAAWFAEFAVQSHQPDDDLALTRAAQRASKHCKIQRRYCETGSLEYGIHFYGAGSMVPAAHRFGKLG